MSVRPTTLVIALLMMASCTGGGEATPSRSALSIAPPPSASSSTLPTTPTPFGCDGQGCPQGGSPVFGAEQWPECLNPITSCGASDWTWYSVLEHVLPRTMQLDVEGNFVASPMLVEAPTLENRGLTQDPFTVRFRISDTAVWEDGTPITSSDFAFTWRANISTRNAYGKEVYDLIEDIDTTDPKTAVIRLTDAYADWADLFGGAFGFVLKAAAFPNKAHEESPDLSERMLDNIPFSGGPWILESWSQDQAVLARNEHYFGRKPILDRVVMVPRTDQSTELASVVSGEVQAIYPEAADTPLLDTTGNPATRGDDGLAVESVIFDLDEPPLDDVLVRQAVLFALDRQAVVDQLASINHPQAAVLNCGFVAVLQLGQWCRTKPFERYTYDPDHARNLLEQAGYDCSTTPCTKAGKQLRIQISTLATRTLRTSAESILVTGALEAGIEFHVKNVESALFGDSRCPFGFSQISVCPLTAAPDPTVTARFACDQFASRENEFSGHNWSAWCDPKADLLMKAADRALDPSIRLDLMDQVYELEAEDAIGIPLFVRPAVSVWRPDQIAGPIGLWNGTPYGLFFNMNEWYVAP